MGWAMAYPIFCPYPYNRVTAFSQTCLFLDRIFDKFRLPREPHLFNNKLCKLNYTSHRGGFVSEQKEVICATNAWNLLMIVQEKEIKSRSVKTQ